MRSLSCTVPHSRQRRGLTLVELLVTLALMLIIMAVIVSIFSVATQTITTARTDQDLATIARRLETTLRQDLDGATARFTPPLDPADGLGYFEYAENALSDNQGEDSDDTLAFTSRAPIGQPFTGRIMLPRGFNPSGLPRFEPVTITSDVAEIIYFQRNSNLYRRVLLVVPERRDTLAVDINPSAQNPLTGLNTGWYRFRPFDGFDLNDDGVVDVSWQGANDVSVRPPVDPNRLAPIPNTLSDLTNRHNRSFKPRFVNDYFVNSNGSAGFDEVFDDVDNNGVPDYTPTLYPGIFTAVDSFGAPILNDPTHPLRAGVLGAGEFSLDRLSFPFVFPGKFDTPNPWFNPSSIHSGPIVQYVNRDDNSTTSNLLLNHSPLEIGDNLLSPSSEWTLPPGEFWNWWGYPTWAETRNPVWTAPTKRLNVQMQNIPRGQQAYGISRDRVVNGGIGPAQAGSNEEWLTFPPLPRTWSNNTGNVNNTLVPPPGASWQDDLIATNVRSFDIKVLDTRASYYSSFDNINVTPRYFDLGYRNPAGAIRALAPDEELTFGHDGTIPPRTTDNRFDYQAQQAFGQLWELGDNNSSIVRLQRVWDSWSTDYAFAPLQPVNPFQAGPLADTSSGFSKRPVHPSYPPPYPQPLHGIEITIRLASPDGTRMRQVTVRQDFTNKL